MSNYAVDEAECLQIAAGIGEAKNLSEKENFVTVRGSHAPAAAPAFAANSSWKSLSIE